MFYSPEPLEMHLNAIHHGDVLVCLRRLLPQSVNLIITSPPYYGQRDYGVEGQIGLEENPRAFIDRLVAVFAEAYRVLRDDGNLYVNMGDGYAGSGKGPAGRDGFQDRNQGSLSATRVQDDRPPKSLLGIPWRLAIALQDSGWILREDIIWNKPTAMPESVKDRCTRSHEYIFHFVKQGRYWYAQDAIREPQTGNTHSRGTGSSPKSPEQHDGMIRSNGSYNKAMTKYTEVPGGRNRRSVWSVTSEPIPYAHFATFPTALVEPIILAASPVGGVVLDPFFGSGTTGIAARKHDRHYIGIELNQEYIEIARERLARGDGFQSRVVAAGIEQPSLFAL